MDFRHADNPVPFTEMNRAREEMKEETPVNLHRPLMEAGTCLICGDTLHSPQHHGTWYRCLHHYDGRGERCEHGCNS